MGEELSLDNILDPQDIEGLFSENTSEDAETSQNNNEENNKEENTETTEINPDTLFGESESVGSEEENIEEKEDTDSNKAGSSPDNFYSSIAKAFKEEGIFPYLDDDATNNIKSSEDFKTLVEEQIKASFDERQKRIDEALNYGIEPSEIKKYESTLSNLNSVRDDDLNDESDKGEALRKQLIYQDFLNRGYSKERASREVTKSMNAGTDIEDAKEALKSNIEFFKGQYDVLIDEAREQEKAFTEARKANLEKFKTSILDDKQIFGDLSIDKSMRQKIFDNATKPIYKDPDSGTMYTSLQKYEKENGLDFLKNVSLIYTLTDGFKNIDGLIKGKVNKEVKKGLRELEHTLNNTTRNNDGNIKFVTGVSEDPESFIGKDWSLDI